MIEHTYLQLKSFTLALELNPQSYVCQSLYIYCVFQELMSSRCHNIFIAKEQGHGLLKKSYKLTFSNLPWTKFQST